MTSIGVHSLAQEQAVLALEPDLITPNPVCGLNPCDASSKEDPVSLLSKIQKGLSTEDLEKYLPHSEWLDIRGTIRSSYRQHGSVLFTAETAYSLFPTPTSYSEGSDTHRPAGQNKLERTLKLLPTPIASTGGVTQDLTKGGNRLERELKLLPTPMARDGKGRTGTPNESLAEPIQEYLMGKDKMHPAVPGWMMGFPLGYAEDVLMVGGKQTPLLNTQASPAGRQDAATVSNSTVARSCRNKQRSRLKESNTLADFLSWDEYQKRRGK
jgi:hypothetical protein